MTKVSLTRREWVAQQEFVVLEARPDGFAFASPTVTEIISRNDVWAVVRVLEAITDTRTPLWTNQANLRSSIKNVTGMTQRGIRDIPTAVMTLWPTMGQSPKNFPDLSIGEAITTVLRINKHLARHPHLTKWMQLDQDIGSMWHEPANRGYLVDEDALRRHQQSVAAMRAFSKAYFGRDLISNTAALDWMRQQGIVCLDRDGNPTCSHREFATADIPDAVSEVDWDFFISVRTTAGLAHQLKNIYTNKQADGRTHPTIAPVGTASGRMTIISPAMQNTPKIARDIYRVEDGRILISCDLSQVEPTLAAALSGDPGLLAAVKKDIYEELAVSVWGESARGNQSLRSKTKIALNATSYGMQPLSLGRLLGLSTIEAADLIAAWERTYPTFASWKREIKAEAERGERLTTHGGRPLPALTFKEARKAVAFTIQGSAADLFKSMTRSVAQRIRATDSRAQLWLPLHDELVLSVPDDDTEVNLACAILTDCMTVEVNGVRVSGKPEVIGRSWKKCEVEKS